MSDENKGFFDGNPKTMYLFGLVSGIALTLLLNSVTGTTFAAGSNGNKNVAVKGNTPVVAGDTAAGDTAPKELAEVTPDEHIRGDLNKAKVVLVEYSDFECPFCSRHHPTMEKIVEEYGDQVAWVYRHFPLSFHPEATPAANASECAADQGKFWEYADGLIDGQGKLGDDFYSELARNIGLNVGQFDSCYKASEFEDEVTADQATGRTAGVTGTPATFVNGQFVSGAVPYTTFKQIIDAELAK